ncbi:MAG: FecR domain-containing protein [Tannerellaceae bacterium]|jgi:ferric-dicitrate binding protein FerR (iron transport regulator)|nr:FecR domain-containing protein [Tannerellaceae bacterium]
MNTSYKDLFKKYISNKATNQEIRLLISFIKTNPTLSEQLEREIQNSPPEISDHLKQQMLNRIRKQIHATGKYKPNHTTIAWKYVATFALILLAFTLGRYYPTTGQNAANTSQPWIITTERGEKAGMTLPDGSRVWLNAASRLTISNAYNKEERRLNLEGEAYFEVAPDTMKPFLVQCKDMRIEALGTTFGVKAYDEDAVISTVLVEGKVRVAMPEQTTTIEPRERIVLNKSTREISTETVNPIHFTEWRKNRLRFENETFEDIARNISRIYNIDYTFADESIKTVTFTGTINNSNLEAILASISLTSYISCTLKDSSIIFRKDAGKKNYFME